MRARARPTTTKRSRHALPAPSVSYRRRAMRSGKRPAIRQAYVGWLEEDRRVDQREGVAIARPEITVAKPVVENGISELTWVVENGRLDAKRSIDGRRCLNRIGRSATRGPSARAGFQGNRSLPLVRRRARGIDHRVARRSPMHDIVTAARLRIARFRRQPNDKHEQQRDEAYHAPSARSVSSAVRARGEHRGFSGSKVQDRPATIGNRKLRAVSGRRKAEKCPDKCFYRYHRASSMSNQFCLGSERFAGSA